MFTPIHLKTSTLDLRTLGNHQHSCSKPSVWGRKIFNVPHLQSWIRVGMQSSKNNLEIQSCSLFLVNIQVRSQARTMHTSPESSSCLCLHVHHAPCALQSLIPYEYRPEHTCMYSSVPFKVFEHNAMHWYHENVSLTRKF